MIDWALAAGLEEEIARLVAVHAAGTNLDTAARRALARDLLRYVSSRDYSAAATKYACELATKFDAELHLLHTLETHLASTPNFGFGLDLPKYVSESKAAAEKSLAGVLAP